jgi:hypothetical protein
MCVRFGKSEEQAKVKLSYEEVHKCMVGHDGPEFGCGVEGSEFGTTKEA